MSEWMLVALILIGWGNGLYLGWLLWRKPFLTYKPDPQPAEEETGRYVVVYGRKIPVPPTPVRESTK